MKKRVTYTVSISLDVMPEDVGPDDKETFNNDDELERRIRMWLTEDLEHADSEWDWKILSAFIEELP